MVRRVYLFQGKTHQKTLGHARAALSNGDVESGYVTEVTETELPQVQEVRILAFEGVLPERNPVNDSVWHAVFTVGANIGRPPPSSRRRQA